MATEAIRSMSDQDLVHGVMTREKDLVHLRFRHSMNQLDNTAQLGAVRREIARMKTEIRAREAAQGLGKGALESTHRRTFGTAAPAEAAAAAPDKGGFLKGIVGKLTGKGE